MLVVQAVQYSRRSRFSILSCPISSITQSQQTNISRQRAIDVTTRGRKKNASLHHLPTLVVQDGVDGTSFPVAFARSRASPFSAIISGSCAVSVCGRIMWYASSFMGPYVAHYDGLCTIETPCNPCALALRANPPPGKLAVQRCIKKRLRTLNY